jgi:hypothetical protein
MKLRTACWIVCALYGGATLAASIAAIASNAVPVWTAALMGISAVFVACLNLKIFDRAHFLVLLPLIAIHVAAIINGYYLGGNVFAHHAARFCVSSVIFALFMISGRAGETAENAARKKRY